MLAPARHDFNDKDVVFFEPQRRYSNAQSVISPKYSFPVAF